MRKVLTLLLAFCLVSSFYAQANAGSRCHPYFKLSPNAQRLFESRAKRHSSKLARPRETSSPNWRVAGLCQAYSIPTNLTGNGVIGILELGGGWVQSDLDDFCTANNLPPITVHNVSVNGGKNSPSNPPNLQSADVEVTLDIEIAAATYYYATGKMPTIKVFFAPNKYSAFAAVINAAVDADCDVLSISWGAGEDAWQADSPGAAEHLETTAQAAAARGLVILAASGDSSSSDGDPGTNVDVPSSCPHIIGAGGTTKTLSTEVVWGDGVATDWGTGGGFSVIFPTQSFQAGAPDGSGRMVPDVAANADPNTGYLMVYGGSEFPVGGTSAVAPFYAGLFAASGRKLGFISPTLWSHPTAFTDITQGSNGAYSAQIGPDACTGLGVPYGPGIGGLFTSSNPVGQLFSINVTDRVAGSYQGTLDLDDPSTGDFSVSGKSSTSTGTYRQVSSTALMTSIIGTSDRSAPLLPGTFYAIVLNVNGLGLSSILGQSPAWVLGAGFGWNSSNKFEFYEFSGHD